MKNIFSTSQDRNFYVSKGVEKRASTNDKIMSDIFEIYLSKSE